MQLDPVRMPDFASSLDAQIASDFKSGPDSDLKLQQFESLRNNLNHCDFGCDSYPHAQLGKEKTNKHKEFSRDTPWCVSRLSLGYVPSVPSYVPSVARTFCPLNWNCHIIGPNVPGVPGTSRMFPWDASGAFRPPNSFM